MAHRYMGFMQLDQLIAGYRVMWPGLNPFRRCQSYSIFISDFYLVCDQIAVQYLNIWLSYGGNMTPCIYEILQPVQFISSRRISLQ